MRPALPILALFLLAPAAARADVRLWQEEETLEVGYGEPEDEPRHLDLFAFVQPVYAWLEGYGARAHQLTVYRARVGLAARLYPFLTMRIDLGVAPTPHLTDAYLDLEVIDTLLRLRAGRFEIPLLRRVQFYDAYEAFGTPPPLAPADVDTGAFGPASAPLLLPDRDLGAMIHGAIGDADFGPYLEYGAGVLAGGGVSSIDRAGLMLAIRLEGHLFGLPIGDTAENDLARNERPRISLGAGAFTNCNSVGELQRGVTVDTELRWRGLYVSGSFLRARSGTATGESAVGSLLGYDSDAACGVGADFPRSESLAVAGSVQAQYVLPPLLFPLDGQALEVLLRFALVSPHDPPEGLFGGPADGIGPPNQWRLAAGLNWYPTSEPIFRLSVSYERRVETETLATSTGERLEDIDDDVLWVQATAGL